jgi:hypothetical protein
MIKSITNVSMATTVPDGGEKIKNAIAFFALEYERLTHKPLAVTALHKYLAFLDYASLKKVGHPAFGLFHRTTGRILTDPWERRETRRDDCFVLIPQKGGYVVKATGKPDLSCFSSFELDEMKRLVKINADRLARVLHKRFSSFELGDMKRLVEVNADRLGRMPHKRDDTREETRAEIKNAVVSVSEVSFFIKRKEVDEMSGLNLLVEKYETRLKELEAQMAEVKRKLETVTEALRLLKEEGLSEDEPRPR